MSAILRSISIVPVSLIDRDGHQLVRIRSVSAAPMHLRLSVYGGGSAYVEAIPFSIDSGRSGARLRLPPPEQDFNALWVVCDEAGKELSRWESIWRVPRHWTIYTMISSHTDIGLHNSQYIQRDNSSRFLEKAMALCDETACRPPEAQYRYVMEGSWFWSNFGADRGEAAARDVVEQYILPGRIGVCAGVAGNHTQTYGLEELCRSTYSRRYLQERWGISCDTMSMIDNNGMSWAIVQPYADAGYRNVIFSPNQWNPIPSTVWSTEYSRNETQFTWDCCTNGGGSRIDIRYDSQLPMVFWWEDASHTRRLLVWGCEQYSNGGHLLGFDAEGSVRLPCMEERIAETLSDLEEKCPYDVWLTACYYDDQEPTLGLTDQLAAWNREWVWPRVQTLGRPDEPFTLLRERFGDVIPVLHGDITGGWYQHPLSAAELLSRKLAADRLLPTAEKLSSLAAMTNAAYRYPADAFRRAWRNLILNDEHSYGTSGYQGRRVYETWMQHRDWIDKALETGERESETALKALSSQICCRAPGSLVFNPMGQSRPYLIRHGQKELYLREVPALGYTQVPDQAWDAVPDTVAEPCREPPTLENRFYRLRFGNDGQIVSILDKTLDRELLEPDCPWGANQFLYTRDRHVSFVTPKNAVFTRFRSACSSGVIVQSREPISGAVLTQTVTLPDEEPRVDMDNRLEHVRDLWNTHRYDRYGYFAFPLAVPGGRRICALNGCQAEYAVDVTGHGTDTYLAAHEWVCVENDDFGIGLVQLDSELVEFDHIHPDKTDFGRTGDGTVLYSYLMNDWLQMHMAGGSHADFTFRYSLASFPGGETQRGIAALAERLTNPCVICPVTEHPGVLPERYSFLSACQGRLINLKRAEDGQGLIARLYRHEPGMYACTLQGLLSEEVTAASIDERPVSHLPPVGFATLRLGRTSLRLPEAEPQTVEWLAIGGADLGLITEPRAACGEHRGHLYLLWGQCQEPELHHYELFRSQKTGFTPDRESFLTTVEPGPYREARYSDIGLADHERYFYRVRAVSVSGAFGPMSAEFAGITRELKEDEV